MIYYEHLANASAAQYELSESHTWTLSEVLSNLVTSVYYEHLANASAAQYELSESHTWTLSEVLSNLVTSVYYEHLANASVAQHEVSESHTIILIINMQGVMKLSYMEQLMNEEYSWAHEIDRKKKKKTAFVYLPLTLLGVEAFILAIALLNHAMQAEIIRNLLVGLGIFAFIAILMGLMILLPNMAKGHVKAVRKAVKKAIPDASRQEEFAKEMFLKENGEFRSYQFKLYNFFWYVDISRDYIFCRANGIQTTVVRLNDLAGVQMDTRDRKGGPLYFFYRGNTTYGTENERPDESFPLPTRELQREIATLLGSREE